MARGAVRDAAGFEGWLGDILHHGSGWQDAVLLAEGLRPGADFGLLDDWARALAPGAERLAEALAQGGAFARTVGAVTGRALPPRALPVAVAEAARPLALPPAEVIALHLTAMATNLAIIAVRLIPLGQTDGQRVLAALAPAIAALAERAAGATLDDLGAAALAADLDSLAHETLQPRLWQT